MNETVTIVDKFQDYMSNNVENIDKYNLSADVIIFCLIAYTYYTGNAELYTKIVKYSVIFLLIRYIASLVTNYQTSAKKSYFQLNGHIGIFTLLILTNAVFDLSIYTSFGILVSYTLFVSAIKYGHTVDNFITLLVVYNLLQYKI
jgi:hypothetical protein